MATVVSLPAAKISFKLSSYHTVNAGGIPNYTSYGNMPDNWLRKYGGSDYGSEKQLYRSLITESINKHGVSMTYYITSYDTQYDKIWGEDNDRRLVRKFNIMSFYKLPSEDRSWTRFGIEGLDQFDIHVSKDHFRVASTYSDTRVRGNIGKNSFPSYIPRIGDIVKADYNDFLYEIVDCKETAFMFAQDKHYLWKFTLNVFKDEGIGLSADTEDSMDVIKNYTNQSASSDIFNLKSTVDEKIESIKFSASSNDVDLDPFANF